MSKFDKYEGIQVPWLIQRCKLKPGWKPTSMVSEYLSFDYMGSSEFEFGTIPKALREFHKRLNELNHHRLQINGKVIHILAKDSQVPGYTKFLEEFANASDPLHGGPRLKEFTSIGHFLQEVEQPSYMDDEFWIDLDNFVAIGQNKGPIMNFKDSVVNSVRFMDSKK